VKNPNQPNLFDPWDFLTPKRRQMLDAGWPALFPKKETPGSVLTPGGNGGVDKA